MASRIFQCRFMPHLLMLFVQIIISFVFFLVEAAFDHGLNPHVFVTYRCLVGGMVMFPFAYFHERKLRPTMTFALFLEISLLALLGATLSFNLSSASLKYTSSSFVSTMPNTAPGITFATALILGLEVVDVRKPRGIAKIIGALVSLAGALTIGLYRGIEVQSWRNAPFHIRKNSIEKNWVKGSILVAASTISWCIWCIVQAYTLKKYPAKLSLTTMINLLGFAQSAVFTALVQHDPSAWRLSSKIELWAIIYAGALGTGIVIFIQLWCTKQKGPVFVTMFSPISTVLVAVFAYCLFGEELRIGSVLGGVIAIVGLYALLWGKEGDIVDQNKLQTQSCPISDEEKAAQTRPETIEISTAGSATQQ